MWNPFKKKNNSDNPNQMGFVQRLAMKKMMSMSEEQRNKLLQKALTPENISKNKDKIMAAMEQMKSSGQLSNEQMELAKKKMGL
ncbi:MAG: hypothetical protein Q7S18_01930 [bacterium]|nr:hypothetical protein [bacterium]